MEVKLMQVLVMDNGEILCLGKTLGWEKEFKSVIRSYEQLGLSESKKA